MRAEPFRLPRIRSTTAALAVAAGALAATVAVPASAQPPLLWTSLIHEDADSSGSPPCSTTGYFDGRDVVTALAAHLVRPEAAGIRVTCRIVQNGVAVGSVTAVGGPVATNAAVVRVRPTAFSVCADLYVMYLDGSEAYDYRCP